uniref:Transmembrane protein 59-like n=1 Tax=Paramormyrops kingsleyae TaxID=1676925 RepID=A0A3B3TDK7_9TELE|nr:transmembrane protein 59-like isoform X1 [Paramormyrops kingsleyae]
MFYVGVRVCAAPALVSLLLLGFAVASSDVFDTHQGDISYCKKRCQMAAKNKNTAKDAVLNACHRGCLLFSICQFVNGNAGFNASKEECHGACREAYGRPAELEACDRGCGSQRSEAESRRRRLKALVRRSRPRSVVDLLSSWCSDVISSAQSLISSSWTLYLRVDDGKVVTLQAQPEGAYHLPKLQVPRSDVSHTQRPHAGEGDPPACLQHGPHAVTHPHVLTTLAVLCGADFEEACVCVKQHGGKAGFAPGGKLRPAVQHAGEAADEHDFLGCMSRRSGLPRWILASCIFLSIMVMLWLSCASLVTAPEQHVKAQLSINGDKDFWEDVQKVAPYHVTPVIAVAVSQSDAGKEVGPLPVKVDLSKATI